MTRVLISDDLNEESVNIFNKYKIKADVNTDLSENDLIKIISKYDGLAIRSNTQVTKEVIKNANKLRVIGRAGIGTDNIDFDAATKKGIVIMNTPFGNSITTAEHTMALMLSLARNIPLANSSTHTGKWEKSSFTGTELHSKILGMIGCGNIGSIVANRAHGFKMQVKVYDPFLSDQKANEIGVEKIELNTLLKCSDFLTLHVPLNKNTKNIINSSTLKLMKKGAKIINCARGGLVNEKDLAYSIKKGHISGAAFDVFNKEPARENPLFGLKEVVVTPHLGASTEEAQKKVSIQVAEQIAEYLNNGTISNGLNIASVKTEELANLKPYMKLSEQIGRLAGQITETSIKKVKIEYIGQAAYLNTNALTNVLLAGLLSPSMEAVNMVNASIIAKNRNIDLTTSIKENPESFVTEINLIVETERRIREVAGTLYAGQPRIVKVMGTKIEAELGKHMLFITNEDKPGFIGELGTKLANAKINIATFHLGRTKIGGDAVALIEVDELVSQQILKEIKNINHVKSVKSLTFEENII